MIDFKTGRPKDDHNILYGRQLHAYSYALENPADGALKLTPISKPGLLYFPPERTKQDNIEQLLYETDIQWIEVKRDNENFLNFLNEVMGILESKTLPEPSPNCDWCNYFKKLNNLNNN